VQARRTGLGTHYAHAIIWLVQSGLLPAIPGEGEEGTVSSTENAPVPDVGHFPVTIAQRRRKAAADAISCVVLAAICVSAYDANVSHSQAWSAVFIPLDIFAAVVLGLGAINYIIEIARPPRLVLDVHGITQRSLLRTHTIPWREVDNFRACRVLPFLPSQLVRFDFVRPHAGHPILRAILRRFGIGTTLGPGWAIKAERLAELLSVARGHWVGSPQSG
jgi:hypothetical protein